MLTKFVSGQVSHDSHEQLLARALYSSDLTCNVDKHHVMSSLRHVRVVASNLLVILEDLRVVPRDTRASVELY